MRHRKLAGSAALAAVALAVFFVLTQPHPIPASAIPAHTPDLKNGEVLYHAGGCISCHKPAAGQAGVDMALPSGGAPLKTPAGVFYPPNITPDPETGIGKWTDADFINAMQRGIAPDGHHYIPAFPYTSYAHMTVPDILDIKAYLFSLPPVKSVNKPPEMPLGSVGEWAGRRLMGLWQLAGLDSTPYTPDPSQSAEWNRGAYLVKGPGHCGECHTPRTLLMTSDTAHWLEGGPHPEGDGKVPNLVGLIERKRYKDANDLKSALQFGETFGYDKLSAGGMGAVQTNLSKLPDSDVAAIATYLASLKPKS
jgi:mono/diheme cytochrome c family protein